jgi:hypothetical protein
MPESSGRSLRISGDLREIFPSQSQPDCVVGDCALALACGDEARPAFRLTNDHTFAAVRSERLA